MQILERKGFDLRGFYQQTAQIEMSGQSEENLAEFLELLKVMSTKNEFQSSDYNTSIRTADLANEAIYGFSKLFQNGKALKLRDVIDGVIFYGYSDGPVCVVYNPESLGTYKLTGAGYFLGGDAVIESDIEALAGRRGSNLASSFQTAQELDQDAQEAFEEKNQRFRNVLANYSTEKSTETDFINSIPEKIKDILEPLRLKLVENIPEDIMIERLRTTPGWNKFLKDMADSYHYIQCIVSILAEPMLNFIEYFGPGLEIISKEEFEKYCDLFREYAMNSSNTPSLSDFVNNNLDYCQYQ